MSQENITDKQPLVRYVNRQQMSWRAVDSHTVSLHVLGSMFKIRAGFADKLPAAGLLGRIGFFEHFKITFDPSSNPAGFDLERVSRA
jgi:hypothetical protein